MRRALLILAEAVVFWSCMAVVGFALLVLGPATSTVVLP